MADADRAREPDDMADLPTDIMTTAWVIAAKHLTRGQRDVTKMIADGIHQERRRCVELMRAALGPDADRGTFVEAPDQNW